MKKLILASAAAFILTSGYANAAGIILGSDENDRKVWINTWAGQTADKKRERHGSSVSTFSGRRSPDASRSGGFFDPSNRVIGPGGNN